MTIAIRELAIADTMLLEELMDACQPGWSDALAPGASGPMAFTADPRTFVFGAYVNNEPAGWVWGVDIRRPDGRVMTYVHQLHVVEAHRRTGIAASLMEAAIGRARSIGSHRLWLVTGQHNDGAQALYESLGADTLMDHGELVYLWAL